MPLGWGMLVMGEPMSVVGGHEVYGKVSVPSAHFYKPNTAVRHKVC